MSRRPDFLQWLAFLSFSVLVAATGQEQVAQLIYFTAHDETHGIELWRSDGTEAGTVLVADIEPGPRGSLPLDLKVMDGKLYFHAERRDVGRELFVIDLPKL